jgi:dihydrofolate synthase/folylpolyglutamate synthase
VSISQQNSLQIKTYQEATEWLFQQFPSYQEIGASAYKPDLGNVRLLCALFDNPQNNLRFIHIAGTNGKGSTSSMLASILTESNEKVGLFTSPHIIDFRERIRVNGEKIAEVEVIQFCNQVIDAKLSFEPSFFEITFVLALLHYQKCNCTICVIETGLGGRLDATNIITPILSIITNISLEHTQFLGTTITEIAGEKAGIIKQTIPVVIGETSVESKNIFQKTAALNNSPIYWAEDLSFDTQFEVSLLGDYQKRNFRSVQYAVEILNKKGFDISNKSISKGLQNLSKNTGFYGRMQVVSKEPLTILDVSHNLEGIQQTLETLKKLNQGKLHIIYGTSSDKNYSEIISIFPRDAAISLCSFKNARSLSFQDLERISKLMSPHPQLFNNVKEALTSIQSIANKEDTILVFGSFFLISDYF